MLSRQGAGLGMELLVLVDLGSSAAVLAEGRGCCQDVFHACCPSCCKKKQHDPPWKTLDGALLWREKQPRPCTEAQPGLRADAARTEGREQPGHGRGRNLQLLRIQHLKR